MIHELVHGKNLYHIKLTQNIRVSTDNTRTRDNNQIWCFRQLKAAPSIYCFIAHARTRRIQKHVTLA